MEEITATAAFFCLFLIFSTSLFAQKTETVWRANIINPGVELELPTTPNSTFSVNVGIGSSGSYPNLSETSFDNGGIFAIAPFADVQFKKFYNLYIYNLYKRARRNKVTDNNSGNFFPSDLDLVANR